MLDLLTPYGHMGSVSLKTIVPLQFYMLDRVEKFKKFD